jgi:hypothetical protein
MEQEKICTHLRVPPSDLVERAKAYDANGGNAAQGPTRAQWKARHIGPR